MRGSTRRFEPRIVWLSARGVPIGPAQRATTAQDKRWQAVDMMEDDWLILSTEHRCLDLKHSIEFMILYNPILQNAMHLQ